MVISINAVCLTGGLERGVKIVAADGAGISGEDNGIGKIVIDGLRAGEAGSQTQTQHQPQLQPSPGRKTTGNIIQNGIHNVAPIIRLPRAARVSVSKDPRQLWGLRLPNVTKDDQR